eukprot:2033568-Pyramimonas_sp.AAC.2
MKAFCGLTHLLASLLVRYRNEPKKLPCDAYVRYTNDATVTYSSRVQSVRFLRRDVRRFASVLRKSCRRPLTYFYSTYLVFTNMCNACSGQSFRWTKHNNQFVGVLGSDVVVLTYNGELEGRQLTASDPSDTALLSSNPAVLFRRLNT